MPTITVHSVEIAIDGVPTYLIDVPTTLGREAAERRARAVVFCQLANNNTDLDRITVYRSN